MRLKRKKTRLHLCGRVSYLTTTYEKKQLSWNASLRALLRALSRSRIFSACLFRYRLSANRPKPAAR